MLKLFELFQIPLPSHAYASAWNSGVFGCGTVRSWNRGAQTFAFPAAYACMHMPRGKGEKTGIGMTQMSRSISRLGACMHGAVGSSLQSSGTRPATVLQCTHARKKESRAPQLSFPFLVSSQSASVYMYWMDAAPTANMYVGSFAYRVPTYLTLTAYTYLPIVRSYFPSKPVLEPRAARVPQQKKKPRVCATSSPSHQMHVSYRNPGRFCM